jgi:hypothetical protein
MLPVTLHSSGIQENSGCSNAFPFHFQQSDVKEGSEYYLCKHTLLLKTSSDSQTNLMNSFIWTLFVELRGGIQNIPDWCRHLHSRCGSARHQSQQTKLWIPGSTASFYGDWVKTCEDVAPKLGENRPGCFILTTPRLTLPSSPSSFWRNTNDCHPPPTVLPWFSTLWLLPISKKWNWSWKDAGLIPLRNPGRIADSAWHWHKPTSSKGSKMEKTVGLVSTCGRELLRGWWRPIGRMMSFMIFTASVRNILETLSYTVM